MSFSSIWITLLITLHALDPVTLQVVDNACALGDFCTYQCHCNNSCLKPDGLCSNNTKCDKSWFGLRCQYKDLLTVPGVIMTFNPQLATSAWLTDRDDSTCNTDPNLQSVTVSWDREYPFTWIRIVMTNTTIMSTIKVYYNITNGYQECAKVNWSRLGQSTMDITCEENVKMNSLKIVGNITSLCTLYISGGRNVAYKQNATQSSAYYESGYLYNALLAVDGNSDSDFITGSCSHTNAADKAPRFDLIFNSAFVVKYFVLYNRNNRLDRLQGFRLLTLDVNNNKVDNFKDTTTSPQMIYIITGNASNPIISLSINETKLADEPFPILTLCEVEVFGECPAGKWSLPCTKQCNTTCPTSCHRDDGSCNTVCAGHSNPPKCTHACVSTKWGINCANDCSTRCVDTSCDSKTGLCDRGCLGYNDPPYCTIDCVEGSWGLNCSQPCSSNCMTNSCNVFTAACHQGCKIGYRLPDCIQECQSGYWGINCSTKCNDNCYTGECNRINGSCVFGCKEGFQLPDCNKECPKGTYGWNCSMTCSTNCIDGICNTINGYCTCRTGYEGNTCDAIQEPGLDSKSFGAGIGAGIGIMVFLVILVLVIVVLCMKLRHRSSRPKATPMENVQVYDKSNVREEDLHTYEEVTDNFQESPTSYKPSASKDQNIKMQRLASHTNTIKKTNAYNNIPFT